MKHSSFRNRCAAAILAATAAFSLSHYSVAEPKAAIMMPKAHKSLLLDIQAVAHKLIAVGERGHVLVSTDNGESWQQSAVPTAQTLTAVHFINEKQGWAVGHDGNVVHSNDGGTTWELQRDGLAAQAERNELLLKRAHAKLKSLKRLAARGAETDEQGNDITEEIDEAQYQVSSAQEKMHAKPIAPPLMDVWFANEQQGWAVGAFGTLLTTIDGGKTWEDISDTIADSIDGYHLNSVVGASDGLLILAGEGGYINVSHDYGQTWEQAELNTESTVFGISSNADGSFIVATGLRGVSWRSEDRGQSWQELYPDVDYSLSDVALKGDTLLMVGAGGTIAMSHDKGESFEVHILANRSGLSQGTILDSGKFLLVGQGGIHHFDPKAVDQK